MGKVAIPKEFAPNRHALPSQGGTVRYLGRQYDGEKLVHYRGFKEDLTPHKARVESLAKASDRLRGKSEYEYAGSVPRVVIHDWLMKQGKNWHEFATDKDLKAKFMAWYRGEYKLLMAGSHQERRLTTDRTRNPVRKPVGPSTGSRILKDYQKELSQL